MDMWERRQKSVVDAVRNLTKRWQTVASNTIPISMSHKAMPRVASFATQALTPLSSRWRSAKVAETGPPYWSFISIS